MELVDTHSHLNDEAFAGDLEEVLRRAVAAGVLQVVVPGFDLPSSRRALALAGGDSGRPGGPQLFAAVGVHPHDARNFGREEEAELRRLARTPGVVAIGEVGLDFHYDYSPRPTQQEVFRRQLGLAAELGLPVIVHSREAEEETLAILEAAGVGTPGGPQVVLHCFLGSRPYAERALAFGCWISLAGPITFKKLQWLREIATIIPPDKLLVETDAPYLAPEPYRGRRNEPAHVREVAAKLAEVRGLSLAEVAASTTAAARSFFRLSGTG
ncbi:MAG: TatD family hydrolase [Limnochordales bacterium]|nr:TatD family hydrolase [Limnochordales bacterium]